MLVKARSFKGFKTPLLVPSFSSKGFPDVKKIITYTGEVISDQTLASAYDIHHKFVTKRSLNFAPTQPLFLDSGGYESSRDKDLSDLNKQGQSVSNKWTKGQHQKFLDDWKFNRPTVVVSFDSPRSRAPLNRQVERANKLFGRFPQAISNFLIKPEKVSIKHLDINEVIESIHLLKDFDIIGVTEKELGKSTFERMKNIAHLRAALDTVSEDKPIHVFGSLDPISSPLYFLSGADIFDGLTWLRFAYSKKYGLPIYKHNYGALELGISHRDSEVDPNMWNQNYYYLTELQSQMRQYLHSGDFNVFSNHNNFFKNSYERLLQDVGGV